MEEKKKMQSVKFRNIQEMLDYLPEDQLAIVEKLREIIAVSIPEAEEYLSFNVPFYRRYKSVCFIWPGAVAWGSTAREGVELGFAYGCFLADEINYFAKGTRKQVTIRRFHQMEEIDEDLLRMYLLEAVEVDDMQRVKKGR